MGRCHPRKTPGSQMGRVPAGWSDTFESLGLLNTIFMKSLKTGQYKRAQPLQKQSIKNVFLVVGFFNIRTVVKPRRGKMTLKDHGGKK